MDFTYTENQISDIAEKILSCSNAKTFLLYGEMGVGKTTLIKEIVKQLGVENISGSPTFSIINEYESQVGIIYHFDFYRLNHVAEAYDIGVEDYFYNGDYIFIEWPEKIKSILPEKAIKINLTKNNNGSRTVTIVPVN